MLDAPLLSRHFLKKLQAAYPAIRAAVKGPPDYIATISPESPDVPALSIWFNNEEITVVLGSLWHTHVDSLGASENATIEGKAAYMANTAVAIVSDIVSGQASFTATYKGDKLLSCSTQVGDRKASTISLDTDTWFMGSLRAFLFRRKTVVYRWTGIEKQ